jgi:hypothetical protein
MILAGSCIFSDQPPFNFWLDAPMPFPRRQGPQPTLRRTIPDRIPKPEEALDA